jgi:cbb3-type cytochrome oxidase subunit 3
MSIDLANLRGILTAVLLVLFIALVRTTWSAARRSTYERAAQAPLEEDVGVDAGRPTPGART